MRPCASWGIFIHERKPLAFSRQSANDLGMSAPYKTSGPVTLSEEQILALHQKLRDLRHDVNGRLANIVAAAELIRMRPASAEERLKMLLDQPLKVADCIGEFSKTFESAFGLTRS
jgi:hypothetical protein